MTMRSDVLIALRQRSGTWKVTQPRLNDLLRGRIDKFSLDMLIELAGRADIHVHLRVGKAA